MGRLIHLAAEAGWRAEGMELNPRTSAYAARATGLPVHRADLRDLQAEGRRYGAVTLVDVLEHIAEPVGALRAVRGVLEPGGWIAVKVPHGPNQLLKERIRGRVFRGYRPTVADNLVHVSHFTPARAAHGAGAGRLRGVDDPPRRARASRRRRPCPRRAARVAFLRGTDGAPRARSPAARARRSR